MVKFGHVVRPARRFAGFGALALLAACVSGQEMGSSETFADRQDRLEREETGTFHGDPRGFVVYSSKEKDTATGSALAVDRNLWRASLETVIDMPLAQADSAGGIIITEWYDPPETDGERVKVSVYLLEGATGEDALRVSVFRQTGAAPAWNDAGADQERAERLESDILRRAEELRQNATG